MFLSKNLTTRACAGGMKLVIILDDAIRYIFILSSSYSE